MQTSSNSIQWHLRAFRAALSWLALLGPTPWLWGIASATAHAAARGVPVRPEEALTAVMAAAALAGLLWMAIGVALELLARGSGVVAGTARRVSAVMTPRMVRHTVGVLLGGAVAIGVAPAVSVASPAMAVIAPAPPPDPGFAPLPDPGWAPLHRASAPRRDGWVPSPPVVRSQPDVRVLSTAPRPGTTREAHLEVVVRRGDSLWSIAARHLGHDPSDAEIARAWPMWFEANRDVIGGDPDLLRPGQLLRAPDVVPS